MKTLIALMALTFFGQSHAYDLSKKFGIGGSLGFPVPVWGNNFNHIANPEWGASIHGRYHFDPTFGLDLSVSKEAFKKTSHYFEDARLLGLWRTAGASDFTPVLGLGAGLTRIENYSPKSLKLSLLARGGLEYGFSPSLSFGALFDYQYVSKIMGDMPSEPAHVINPQVAVTWYFGGDDGAMKEEKPALQDKVSDVVSTGESSTAREEIKPDITVEFDFAQADIKPEYIERIQQVAIHLKENKDLTGYIEGHADSTGPETFNDHLSLQRAEAVKRKLVEYGVDQNRLKTEGFGENRPVADNATREGRQMNRRSAVYISVRTKLSSIR